MDLTTQLIENEERVISNHGVLQIQDLESPTNAGKAAALSSLASNEDEPIDIDESGRITKIKMPTQLKKHGLKVKDGSKMIGDYVIEKTLGQGTFGKVKQGYHVYTGQKVAIKILDKWKIDDINDIERVAREIHILKIVRHPSII